MVQLYSLMWILAVFFAVLGFMRGWHRDIIATAGILVGMFVLFQFDFLIRGILLRAFPRNQAFFLQTAIFLVIVFYAYQNRSIEIDVRNRNNVQSNFIGAIIGFINGYLIGGTLWYFLDINEYPLDPYIVAPSATSPSANSLGSIPLIILSGGMSGGGELLMVFVLVLFLIVVIIL